MQYTVHGKFYVFLQQQQCWLAVLILCFCFLHCRAMLASCTLRNEHGGFDIG